MKKEIALMHNVWDGLVIVDRKSTHLPQLNFDDIISSVFSAGPFYFYIIDFYDMSISNISAGFEEAHGLTPAEINNINDILALVHPHDMDLVAKAEKKAFEFIYSSLGVEKITRYKISYNFRFKCANGEYKMYNHQSLILTVDSNNNFIKSLNIHTDISHITTKNNDRVSLIGLGGEPSFLNMRVLENSHESSASISNHTFSNREIEILRLLANGLDAKSISEKLFISVSTVKTHRKNIIKKSACKNTLELIAKSTSEGWI